MLWPLLFIFFCVWDWNKWSDWKKMHSRWSDFDVASNWLGVEMEQGQQPPGHFCPGWNAVFTKSRDASNSASPWNKKDTCGQWDSNPQSSTPEVDELILFSMATYKNVRTKKDLEAQNFSFFKNKTPAVFVGEVCRGVGPCYAWCTGTISPGPSVMTVSRIRSNTRSVTRAHRFMAFRNNIETLAKFNCPLRVKSLSCKIYSFSVIPFLWRHSTAMFIVVVLLETSVVWTSSLSSTTP